MATYKLTIGTATYTLNAATNNAKLGDVTLTKLSFDKGLYRPGEIHATFTITSTSATSADIKGVLVEDSDNKRLKVKLTDSNSVTYAENYCVFKFKPIFKKVSGATSITVELDIFSEDKLLTFDKYSRAYTAKKLGTDIFKNKMPVTVTSNASTVTGNLNVLKYTDTSSNKENEFIQPYLVQYNESFYDFLKRTANRCGEFLYHENGTFQLGLTINDKSGTTYNFPDKASEYYFEDIYEGNLSVGDYGYKYLEDASKKNLPYDDPLAADDYLDKTGKNYTSFEDEMFDVKRNVAGFICDGLNATSLGEVIGNFTVSYLFQAIAAGMNEWAKNNSSKKVNVTPWEGKNFKENWDGDLLRQFATGVDQSTSISTSTTNLFAEFYASVRNLQKKIGHNALVLKFESDLQNLMIGDHILCESKHYLVIDVKGSLEYAKNDKKYVIEQQVVAIPFYETGTDPKNPILVPIPPALVNTTICESKAQPAVVVENLDPKKIGRVRVKFAWQGDDNEDVSPWIRISIPFATDGGGIKFVPEPDDEVMIDFIDGNVERPYVVGSLLSPKSNDTWGSLPDRTITSRNGHSITFNDDEGGRQFFTSMVPVLSGFTSFIPNELIPDLGDRGLNSLVGGTTISDRCGFYKIEMNTTTRSVLIKSSLGDISLNAFTGISINAPNGDISIKGKNVSIEAANKVSISSGSNIKNRYFPDSGLDSTASLKDKLLQSGGRALWDTAYNFSRSALDQLVSKFYDIGLIRTLIEVFSRPIDGTTSIKSLTFVQIEAGKGSVDYPYDSYRKSKTEDVADYVKLQESISDISTQVNSRINSIKETYQKMCAAIKDFADMSANKNNLLNNNETVISFDTIKTKGWDNKKSDLDENDFKFNDTELFNKKYDENDVISKVKTETKLTEEPKKENYKDEKEYNKDKTLWDDSYKKCSAEVKTEVAKYNEGNKEKVKNMANGLAAAFVNLKKCFEDLSLPKNDKIFKDEVQTALNTIFTELKGDAGILKDINDMKPDKNTQEDKSINWDDISKKYRRKAVFKLVGDAKVADTDKVKLQATYNQATDVTDDNAWKSLVEGWVKEVKIATVPTGIKDFGLNLFKSNFKEWPMETFADPWTDATVNRRRWATGANGKILLSDTPNKTIIFDDKGASTAKKNIIISEKSVTDIINSIKAI